MRNKINYSSINLCYLFLSGSLIILLQCVWGQSGFQNVIDNFIRNRSIRLFYLTLLHSKGPKLHIVMALPSAIGLN